MNKSIKSPDRRELPGQLLKIFWPPLAVFLLHAFLYRGTDAYDLFPWIDILMHFLGGLSMAYSLFMVLAALQEHGRISRLDKIVVWTLVFALVATIAVFWEFAEFSLNQLMRSYEQMSLPNTMQDLFMGIAGASAMIGYKIARKPDEIISGKGIKG